MSRIFRLYKGGQNNIDGWERHPFPSTNAINEIPSPFEYNTSLEITSIPSPFARIDLMETAFSKVLSGDTDGSVYHRYVSEVLDLAEIIFDYRRRRGDAFNKLHVQSWSPSQRIGALESSALQYAKTLQLFLEQDKDAYDFENFTFYVITYNGEVIGGTSPTTLYFSSANNLSHLSQEIQLSNGHYAFDRGNFKHLHERSEAFAEYFTAMVYDGVLKSKSKMKRVRDYIEFCINKVSDQQTKIKLNQIRQGGKSDVYSKAESLLVGDANEMVRIHGQDVKITAPVRLEKSYFEIDKVKPNCTAEGPLPLALQNNYNNGGTVGDSPWNPQTNVPYYDNTPLLNRTIPDGQGIQHPWLCLDDLFEPQITVLNFEVDNKNFFVPKVENYSGDNSVLAPIKALFFKYYTCKDLENFLSIRYIAGDGYQVVLSLPIKGGGVIKYSKSYLKNDNANLQELRGGAEGKVNHVNENTGRPLLSVFPINRIKDEASYDGRIHLYNDTKEHSSEVEVNLLGKDGQPIEQGLNPHVERSPHSFYYLITKRYELIEMTYGGNRSLIIPLWQDVDVNQSVKCEFAIDFGTTNTHIECRKDNTTSPEALSLTGEELGLATMAASLSSAGGIDDYVKSVMVEFLPEGIVSDYTKVNLSNSGFPLRTLLSHHGTPSNKLFALADGNYPFRYYHNQRDLDHYETNLKWERNNAKEVACFLDNMALLISQKTIALGGHPKNTRITWTYPTSMSGHRQEVLKTTWERCLQEILQIENVSAQSISLPESVAPYFEYKQSNDYFSHQLTVLVDIGGGTSDVSVVHNNEMKALHSFRFAGNAVFRGLLSKDHGRILGNQAFYKKLITKYVQDLRLDISADNPEKTKKVGGYINSISKFQNKDVSELTALLFFIGSTQELNAGGINFGQDLKQNQYWKTGFLFFYAAICYQAIKAVHINNTLRGDKDISTAYPKYILFSGTGSKILDLITSDINALQRIAQFITEKITGDSLGQNDLRVKKAESQEKAITAKGAIRLKDNPNFNSPPFYEIEKVYNGGHENIKYSQCAGSSNEVFDAVHGEVEEFITLFTELVSESFIKHDVGADSAYFNSILANNIPASDLKDEIIRGFEHSKEENPNEVNQDGNVKEVLFFYPIQRVLFELLHNEPSEE